MDYSKYYRYSWYKESIYERGFCLYLFEESDDRDLERSSNTILKRKKTNKKEKRKQAVLK